MQNSTSTVCAGISGSSVAECSDVIFEIRSMIFFLSYMVIYLLVNSPCRTNIHPRRSLVYRPIICEVCTLQHHSQICLQKAVAYYVSFLSTILNC